MVALKGTNYLRLLDLEQLQVKANSVCIGCWMLTACAALHFRDSAR